eukprot:10729864-Alexandrium_andersonii.AAC.1
MHSATQKRLTMEQVAKMYMTHVKFSPDAEGMSINMANNIQTLWNAGLQYPEVLKAVQDTENLKGAKTPFDLSLIHISEPTRLALI